MKMIGNAIKKISDFVSSYLYDMAVLMLMIIIVVMLFFFVRLDSVCDISGILTCGSIPVNAPNDEQDTLFVSYISLYGNGSKIGMKSNVYNNGVNRDINFIVDTGASASLINTQTLQTVYDINEEDLTACMERFPQYSAEIIDSGGNTSNAMRVILHDIIVAGVYYEDLPFYITTSDSCNNLIGVDIMSNYKIVMSGLNKKEMYWYSDDGYITSSEYGVPKELYISIDELSTYIKKHRNEWNSTYNNYVDGQESED